MSKSVSNSSVAQLDQWFSSRCNGIWEHRYGVTIETTDNPGWLLSFNSLAINSQSLPQTINKLLFDYGAEVVVTDTIVKVFCRSLQGCLDSAAELVALESERLTFRK